MCRSKSQSLSRLFISLQLNATLSNSAVSSAPPPPPPIPPHTFPLISSLLILIQYLSSFFSLQLTSRLFRWSSTVSTPRNRRRRRIIKTLGLSLSSHVRWGWMDGRRFGRVIFQQHPCFLSNLHQLLRKIFFTDRLFTSILCHFVLGRLLTFGLSELALQEAAACCFYMGDWCEPQDLTTQ